MPKDRLKKLLSELQAELDEANSLEPELATKLRQAADAIDRRLAKADSADDDDDDDDDGIIAELLEADQRFEVAHPTIAGTLRQILSTLSSMGI